MKSSAKTQSATSLPRAPKDDAGSRSTRYLLLMGVRIACFALMVLITPYGWYTWLFGAGAIVIPYVAVILANVGQGDKEAHAEAPGLAIEAPRPTRVPVASDPAVYRVSEAPHIDRPSRDTSSSL